MFFVAVSTSGRNSDCIRGQSKEPLSWPWQADAEFLTEHPLHRGAFVALAAQARSRSSPDNMAIGSRLGQAAIKVTLSWYGGSSRAASASAHILLGRSLAVGTPPSAAPRHCTGHASAATSSCASGSSLICRRQTLCRHAGTHGGTRSSGSQLNLRRWRRYSLGRTRRDARVPGEARGESSTARLRRNRCSVRWWALRVRQEAQKIFFLN
eukprot:SAG11_NODE_8969_length_958_cov_1.038417_2_plen_210_part_00